MEYNEYTPHELLHSWIECYWTVKGPSSKVAYPVFPDGCMDLIFNPGSPIITTQAGKSKTNKAFAFIVGNMTEPIWSANTAEAHLVGVRFRPGGLARILREPLLHFTDSSIPVADTENHFLRQFEHACADSGFSNLTWLKKFDHFFLSYHSCNSYSPFQYSLDLIMRDRGKLTVAEVSRLAGISVKQMERIFLTKVGVTPKQLGQVLRFRETRNQLSRSHEDILSLSLKLGYSDHAHLTKSFKSFSGLTPSQYRLTSNV